MKTPKIVETKVRDGEHWESADELREYLRRQLQFFGEIANKGTDEAGWIQLKMSCSRSEAISLVKWAKTEG